MLEQTKTLDEFLPKSNGLKIWETSHNHLLCKQEEEMKPHLLQGGSRIFDRSSLAVKRRSEWTGKGAEFTNRH